MTTEKINAELPWGMREHIIGQTIVKISYMTEEDTEEQGWSNRPIEIRLANGVALTPMSDDEANDGGSLGTNIDTLPTIPTQDHLFMKLNEE